MLHSVLLLLVAAGAAAKEIVVTFPDRGPGYPKGTITLSQASAFDDLTITAALSNMENSAAGNAWQGGRKQTTTTPIIEHPSHTLMYQDSLSTDVRKSQSTPSSPAPRCTPPPAQ